MDFVSDIRAETPSAAAEILSQHEFQLKQKLAHLKVSLENKMNKFSIDVSRRLNFVKPINLQNILFRKIKKYSNFLDSITLFNRPEVTLGVYSYRQRMDEIQYKLKNVIQKDVTSRKTRLQRGHDLLNALDPNQVMVRGYAILKDESGHVISSSQTLKSNLKIKIIQNDGESYAKIL